MALMQMESIYLRLASQRSVALMSDRVSTDKKGDLLRFWPRSLPTSISRCKSSKEPFEPHAKFQPAASDWTPTNFTSKLVCNRDKYRVNSSVDWFSVTLSSHVVALDAANSDLYSWDSLAFPHQITWSEFLILLLPPRGRWRYKECPSELSEGLRRQRT